MEKDKLENATTPKSVKIRLGSKEVEIKKLKSGDYFKAQSLLVAMVAKMAGAFSSEKQEKGEIKEGDIDKFQKNVPSVLNQFPDDLFEFASMTTGEPKEFLQNETYPEELVSAIQAIMEINNFKENLWKSLKPMQALGK